MPNLQAPFPWQQTTWRNLWQCRLSNRLPHALLLSGIPGLGKAQFARDFAKSILCKAPVGTLGDLYQACNQCTYCNWFQAQTHPDYYPIEPIPPSHQIRIDQIRTPISTLEKTGGDNTLSNTYKVIVINPTEALQSSSANALLKSLEEPPENTLFILVSIHPRYLTATLRSRCHWIRCGTPTKQLAQTWLQQQCPNLPLSELMIYLYLSHSAPLQALASIRNNDLSHYEHLLQSLLDLRLKTKNPSEVAALWEKLPPLTLIDRLMQTLGTLIQWQYGIKLPASPLQINLLDALTKISGLPSLFYILNTAAQHRQTIGILNPLLSLENLAYQWAESQGDLCLT